MAYREITKKENYWNCIKPFKDVPFEIRTHAFDCAIHNADANGHVSILKLSRFPSLTVFRFGKVANMGPKLTAGSPENDGLEVWFISSSRVAQHFHLLPSWSSFGGWSRLLSLSVLNEKKQTGQQTVRITKHFQFKKNGKLWVVSVDFSPYGLRSVSDLVRSTW